jgi:hypothetical protein
MQAALRMPAASATQPRNAQRLGQLGRSSRRSRRAGEPTAPGKVHME